VKSGRRARSLFQRDARLEPGQRRAQTEVQAEPGGDVVARVAVEVEGVGRGPATLVAVGGGEEERDLPARLQAPAVELDVARERARHHVRRRVEAQHLLDRARHQRRLGDQPGAERRRARQLVGEIPEQLGRRLVAGDDQ
jgi:hypothetical protein